jgi:hypothetical protein
VGFSGKRGTTVPRWNRAWGAGHIIDGLGASEVMPCERVRPQVHGLTSEWSKVKPCNHSLHFHLQMNQWIV